MKNLNKIKNNRGVSLVAAIAIMVIMAILGVTLASMLGVTSRGSLDYLRSVWALGLAQAGLNWYMMQLVGITDWDTTANQIGIPLGEGAFDVTLSNKASPQIDSATATGMDISVTAKVTGTGSVTIKRTMSQRAWKLPSATKFALFWGRDVANLSFSSVAINGDFWSIGRTNIPSGSSLINGSAYRPAAENIVGGGSYTEVNVGNFPYFSNFTGSTASNSTPQINPAYYTNLITDYNNNRINACASSATVNQNTNLVLTGNTICCRTFNTNTSAGSNVTISGYGFIVANRDINLNTSGTTGRSLIISPSGGNIVFLAGRSLTVNSAIGTNTVSGLSGIRMYSGSQTSASQLLVINNDNTDISGALMLANRRMLIQNSADLANCILFVNDAGSATNNNLTVTSGGTTVGTAVGPCSLISIGRGNPSLAITTTPSVVGLIYQRDANNLGRTRITGLASTSRVNITGTVIADAFSGNVISNANITYDPFVIPDPPPEGFDGFVTKKPDSWSGN